VLGVMQICDWPDSEAHRESRQHTSKAHVESMSEPSVALSLTHRRLKQPG
jgi:hypothetical protein